MPTPQHPTAEPTHPPPDRGVSRRNFLKGLGTAAVSAAALGAESIAREATAIDPEEPIGPGPVPVTLHVNGTRHALKIEPRTTLLEALRTHLGLTGAKEPCDRAACGGCTVLLGDDPVYACSLLAIEAQDREITTIEGVSQNGELTRLQELLVARDGLQCGYCTPGFVLVLTALLRRNPHPTEVEVRAACAGNLCRCGAYPRIFAAALEAAGTPVASATEILTVHDHALA